MTFNEAGVNRDTVGRFEEKKLTAPEAVLPRPRPTRASIEAALPDATDETNTWHIVREGDNYFAETVHGTREDAEAAAAVYRPNPRTQRGLAYVVPSEPDYPATTQARQMYGDNYGDYIQGSLTEQFAKGIDRREESLGALLASNTGN